MTYVVGSGWWCDEGGDSVEYSVSGSDEIRGKDFNNLWYDSINRNTAPEKIIVVDSASPVLPDSHDDQRIEFVSLPKNYGHSTLHVGKYSGWSRSVMLGLQYALMSDAEYFVYVEQDVLLKGKGIVEYCIDKMTTPYMFGSGEGTPQALQQSFFIIRRDGMEPFLRRYQAISCADGDLSPESKFAISVSKFWSLMPSCFFSINEAWAAFVLNFLKGFDELPVGFGRQRPIDFEQEFFYFQHGSDKELDTYKEGVV